MARTTPERRTPRDLQGFREYRHGDSNGDDEDGRPLD
jgi:hypothetical protein